MFQEELKLFQKSNETIWTDEYISKRLLEAHLDESFDGASRRKDSREKIINWINNNINKNSKIIDLGCGPGLYSYELGRTGHKVFGIDFNRESINYANKNKCIKNYVEYKYGNYLKERFKGTYDAALMIYCDFGVLTPNEQKILLEKIKEALVDNGSFIFDVFCYGYMRDKKEHRNWNISQGNDFWNKEPYILLEETKIFEKEGVIGTRYYLIDQMAGKIKEYILWDKCYEEDEIEELMKNNGFKVKKMNRGLIRDKEEAMLIIAEKNKIHSVIQHFLSPYLL